MTDIEKENREEVPPELEEVVSKFDNLKLNPVTSPPIFNISGNHTYGLLVFSSKNVIHDFLV